MRNSPIHQLLRDFHQVSHLEDHSPRLRCIHQFDAVSDPSKPHALHGRGLRFIEADRTPQQRDPNLGPVGLLRRLLRHHPYPILVAAGRSSACSSLPRSRLTFLGSLSPMRPANAARTTLGDFAEPMDFVSTFWMPHDSTTARTAPPAMMPVPSGAGLSNTWPAPNRPSTGCGTVVPLSGTRISDFFAASIPFLIADGTSFALPTPNPTTPCPSPTTTSALKLRFLPPLTTLVTRLMLTTVSFRSSCEASIFSRVSIMCQLPVTSCQLPARTRGRPLAQPRPRP